MKTQSATVTFFMPKKITFLTPKSAPTWLALGLLAVQKIRVAKSVEGVSACVGE